MSDPLRPVSLRLLDGKLEIAWEDGAVQSISLSSLRAACPCATCLEKEKGEKQRSPLQLPVLTLQETAPIRILQMRPVGNYAYQIAFSDGHDSGIYSFEWLRSLGEMQTPNS